MYVKNFLLHSLFYLLVSWAWWDWPLTWLTNHRPSVLWHCWLGHVTLKTVSEMTYNVSSGTLNSTIPYHTSPHKQGLYVMILLFCLSFTWNTRTCRALADLPSSSTVLVAVSMCSAARQSGQCPTYWVRRGLTALAIWAALTCLWVIVFCELFQILMVIFINLHKTLHRFCSLIDFAYVITCSVHHRHQINLPK